MVGASLPLPKSIFCTYGIRLREIHVTPIMDILAGYMLWPGRLMVRASLLEVAIKRSKYGMQANKRSVTPALSGWRSLYCLHILTAAHSPIIVSFVEAMAVAVDPSLAALVVAEAAVLEKKVDTASDPSLAAPVAVEVQTADSNPDVPVLAVGIAAADSRSAAPVAVVPSSAGRQPALRLLRSLHERHVQCGHCECGARYIGLPTPPGQQGSRCQRYGSKVKGW